MKTLVHPHSDCSGVQIFPDRAAHESVAHCCAKHAAFNDAQVMDDLRSALDTLKNQKNDLLSNALDKMLVMLARHSERLNIIDGK